MERETRYCAICAWRASCQRRYSVHTDVMGNVYCNEYTRDLTIKMKEETEKQNQEASSSIDHYIENRIRRFHASSEGEPGRADSAGPVITVSREAGACGTEIAGRLARELNMDLLNDQIIGFVADSAKIGKKIIESLDEKEISRRDAWISNFFESRQLSPDEYLDHLTRVIATIGRYGRAVIVGRGVHYILPTEKVFRVRLIAPLELRIAHIMQVRDASSKEAEKYVLKTDNERQAFIRKYFHADITDPSQYDIVVNMRVITVEGAVEAIKKAFLKSKMPQAEVMGWREQESGAWPWLRLKR